MGFSGGGGGGGSSTVPVAFGTAAARPAAAAGNAGTAYYATDTGEVTFSNGAAWNAIKSVSAPGTDFTINGNGLSFNGGNGPRLDSSNAFTLGLQGSAVSIAQRGGASIFDLQATGVSVAEGANTKQGLAVLVAGTVVVANTSVTATSRIFLTKNLRGGTDGFLVVSARTAGTSFTILSSNAADTGSVAWEIFEVG